MKEYRVLICRPTDSELTNRLNHQHQEEGWELNGWNVVNNMLIFLFERELVDKELDDEDIRS